MGYSCSYSLKIIWFFLFILVSVTSSQNTKCPFEYLYHFGDGVPDQGNSIRIAPSGPSLPAASLPYGITFPGTPTGRWSDGRVDIDFIAPALGVETTAYLSQNASSMTNGTNFAVEGSPVLDASFFASRGVKIPTYAVPLSGQFRWFKESLNSVCSTPTDCANRLKNSAIVFGDIESNDIGYALLQGKSIQEVRSYIPFIIEAIVNAIRELIKMGATRIVIPNSGPLGCCPYILTALPSNNTLAYSLEGCLKSVNNLIVLKNRNLQQAIFELQLEFPHVIILYAPYYAAVETVITLTSLIGLGKSPLKACCGTGGKYNYDSKRFCGSSGVPVCPNPNEYIYWDGLHFTQEAYRRIVQILLPPALLALGCKL